MLCYFPLQNFQNVQWVEYFLCLDRVIAGDLRACRHFDKAYFSGFELNLAWFLISLDNVVVFGYAEDQIRSVNWFVTFLIPFKNRTILYSFLKIIHMLRYLTPCKDSHNVMKS